MTGSKSSESTTATVDGVDVCMGGPFQIPVILATRGEPGSSASGRGNAYLRARDGAFAGEIASRPGRPIRLRSDWGRDGSPPTASRQSRRPAAGALEAETKGAAILYAAAGDYTVTDHNSRYTGLLWSARVPLGQIYVFDPTAVPNALANSHG